MMIKKTIPINLTHTKTNRVRKKDLASSYGSGAVDVLATPAMIAFMEAAALESVDPYLMDDATTVGGYIAVKHLKPTPLKAAVTTTAIVTAVEGRKIVFYVEAYDDEAKIGEGEHHRFVVLKNKFK